MRADFDSKADALDIELVRFERLGWEDSVDDTYCQVGFADGKPVCVEVEECGIAFPHRGRRHRA